VNALWFAGIIPDERAKRGKWGKLALSRGKREVAKRSGQKETQSVDAWMEHSKHGGI